MNVPLNQFLAELFSAASDGCCHQYPEQEPGALPNGEEKEESTSARDYEDDDHHDHDQVLSQAASVTTIVCRLADVCITQVHIVQDNALPHGPFSTTTDQHNKKASRGLVRWISQTKLLDSKASIGSGGTPTTTTTSASTNSTALRQPTRRSSIEHCCSNDSEKATAAPLAPRRQGTDESLRPRRASSLCSGRTAMTEGSSSEIGPATPRKPFRRTSLDYSAPADTTTTTVVVSAGERGRRAAAASTMPKCPQRRGSITTNNPCCDQMIRCPQRRDSLLGDWTSASQEAPDAVIAEELHSSLNMEHLCLGADAGPAEEKCNHHPPTISDFMYSCPSFYEY